MKKARSRPHFDLLLTLTGAPRAHYIMKTPFQFYSEEVRPNIKETHPREISKKIKDGWNALSFEERHKYECMALKDRYEDLKPQRCKGDDCTNWSTFRTNVTLMIIVNHIYRTLRISGGMIIVHHVTRNTTLTK